MTAVAPRSPGEPPPVAFTAGTHPPPAWGPGPPRPSARKVIMSQSATVTRPDVAPLPVQPPPRRSKLRLGSLIDRKIMPYLLVAPFFILFGIFGLYPLITTAR